MVEAASRRITRKARLTQSETHEPETLKKQAETLSKRLLDRNEVPEDARKALEYEIVRRAALFAARHQKRSVTLEQAIQNINAEERAYCFRKEPEAQATLPFPLILSVASRSDERQRRLDPEEGGYDAMSIRELQESAKEKYDKKFITKNFPRLFHELSGWAQTVYEGLARSAVLDREERNIERSEIRLNPALIDYINRSSFCSTSDLGKSLNDTSRDLTNVMGKNIMGVLLRQGLSGTEAEKIMSDYVTEALHWEHPSVQKLVAERMSNEYHTWHRDFVSAFPQYREFFIRAMEAKRALRSE